MGIVSDRLRKALALEDGEVMSQRELHRRLQAEKGFKGAYSAVQRYFSGDTEPPHKVMKDIADILNVLEAWLFTGEGPVREKQADALVRAGLEALTERLPEHLRSHLVHEFRHLSAFVIKLATSLMERGGLSGPEECYRQAGEMLGTCIAVPLEVLGIAPIPDRRIAQSYVTAAAHAVETIAHYARPKVPANRPPSSEEDDDV